MPPEMSSTSSNSGSVATTRSNCSVSVSSPDPGLALAPRTWPPEAPSQPPSLAQTWTSSWPCGRCSESSFASGSASFSGLGTSKVATLQSASSCIHLQKREPSIGVRVCCFHIWPPLHSPHNPFLHKHCFSSSLHTDLPGNRGPPVPPSHQLQELLILSCSTQPGCVLTLTNSGPCEFPRD